MIGTLTTNMGIAQMDDDCAWQSSNSDFAQLLNAYYSTQDDAGPDGDPAMKAIMRAADDLNGSVTIDPEYIKLLNNDDPNTIY